MENNMVKEHMLHQVDKKNMENGGMEKELDGQVEVNRIDFIVI